MSTSPRRPDPPRPPPDPSPEGPPDPVPGPAAEDAERPAPLLMKAVLVLAPFALAVLLYLLFGRP